MKIFIDSGDLKEIRKYLDWGVCDGVTTNPTILMNAGIDSLEAMETRQKAIIELIAPRPLSVEVTTDDPEAMLDQAHQFVETLGWEKIMVKITVANRQGEGMNPVYHQLAREGVSVNVTAITTQNQAFLAAQTLWNGQRKAQRRARFPHAISIFGGRISEEHGSQWAATVIENTRKWLELHDYPIEIIVGSIRSPENFHAWALTGAHILTVPPEVLAKSMTAARSKETVEQFVDDATASLGQIAKEPVSAPNIRAAKAARG